MWLVSNLVCHSESQGDGSMTTATKMFVPSGMARASEKDLKSQGSCTLGDHTRSRPITWSEVAFA
jgi:hypothetical protein